MNTQKISPIAKDHYSQQPAAAKFTLDAVNFRGAVILSTAALLSACGGGGSSAPPATTPFLGPPGPIPSAAIYEAPTVALVASVPTATYPTGSEELAAFETLNAVRTACGFGQLAQNSKLDQAAVGHADWLVRNGYVGHYQDAKLPGFTGKTPADRGVSSGYGQPGVVSVTNLLASAYGPGVNKLDYGKKSVYRLLNAPYHGFGMLSGALEVGVAVRSDQDVGASPMGNRVQADFDLGYRYSTGSQEPETDAVLTFPCGGSTDVDRDLTHEDPNPVPGRNLATHPLGTSVIIRVRKGHTLKITHAAMVETATGTSVVLRPPVGAVYGNDPHGSIGNWEGYVAADQPLKALTRYSVTLEGTNNGRIFSRNFIFTTGN